MNGNGHHVNAPQALIIEARPKTYAMCVCCEYYDMYLYTTNI